MRMIIRRNLERRGVTVIEARTAAEALSELRADRLPDLMLLDINLPDRSGWDVLRELRESGPGPRTIVVSAVRIPPERLREFAVADYLPKPFPIESLIALIANGANGPSDAGPRDA